jgi:hypothetical protein
MEARWLLEVMSACAGATCLSCRGKLPISTEGRPRIRQALQYQPATGLAALVSSRCPSVA